MGKKRARKTKVSKGIHSNVARAVLSATSQAVSNTERALHKVAAWKKGQNPWITIPGPSKNMALVRVRANNYWGDPKRNTSSIVTSSKD